MSKKINKSYIMITAFMVLMVTLACGTFQVGVVTPTSEVAAELIGDIETVEPNESQVDEKIGPAEDESTPEPTMEETPSEVYVVAWLGHIASLPEGSQYDDVVILSPEGTGEFGIIGSTPEVEAELRNLRDAAGPKEFIHLWGVLTCESQDYNGCQLVVDKLQYGANYTEEEVEGWVGRIISSNFNGGPTYAFELIGDFPMWFSINASQDDALKNQIEVLRDTGAIVTVDGTLMTGIPDVNGTRIEVSNLEVVEEGLVEQGPLPTVDDPTGNWPVFVSDRYGYQIKHPLEASISLYGPDGFSGDDLPEGMTPEQYLSELQKIYTNQICVQINYGLGWIIISAPPNKGNNYTICGPSGFGAGEIIAKVENIFIGDTLYQANGHEILGKYDIDNTLVWGETLDMHSEVFRVELEDGTVIAFGAQPRDDATYEDFLMKTKDVLLQILATYEVVP